jgi:hypothetical protein
LGAPSGAFGAMKVDQSGTESRMSSAIFPLYGFGMSRSSLDHLVMSHIRM